MIRTIIVGLLLSTGLAHADDTRRAVFSDSAAVATVRPIALGASLHRLGSGWDTLVRHSLPIPAAVNPFDAAVLSTTGIDPSGVAWFCARALRGGLHLRAVLPMLQPRAAEPLLQTASTLLHAELTRGVDNAWMTRLPDGTPIVARLDGSSLVIDLVLAGATMVPTPADVARVVPLHPPRAFAGTRGAQKRMSAADAVAVWLDLDAASKLGLQRGEHDMTAALKGVAPAQRTALARQSQIELGRCRVSLNATPRSFDDLLLAVTVVSPEQVRVQVASSGRRAALDALRQQRALLVPTHQLGDKSDADLRVTVDAPPLPKPTATKRALEPACPGAATFAELAWGWPAFLASSDMPEWMRALAGVRSLVLSMPLVAEESAGVSDRQIFALAELDTAVRVELDRLLASIHFDATSPLRVEGRSLTAWGPPSYGAEAPIVAIDPGVGPGVGAGSTGTIVAFGARELLRQALEHVTTGKGSATGPIATLSVTARGLRRVLRQFNGSSSEVTMIDGVSQLDSSLVLDEDVMHLDTDLTLKH